MAKFFNSDLAELAHQLALSPRRLRVEQILGIEKLLELVEPDRAYPFEFICHAITKYHKRGPETSALVPGKAVVGDLVTMAETLSRGASLTVEELGGSCLAHEEVAEELHVSSKTIRRWRARGLMGLRASFEDGVGRLVFLRGTVDRFVRQNKDLVARGAAFKQLTETERDRIVERARELVAGGAIKLHTVARTIAEESSRAIETIRYTLRRYDETNPGSSLFAGPGRDAVSERRLAISRCREAGETVASIAGAFDCTAEEIERILRQGQVQQWKENLPQYVYNELFDAPEADEIILAAAEPPPSTVRGPSPSADTPQYLRSLYQTPLLTRELEADLFRRYNYLKYRAARVIEEIDSEDVPVEACTRAQDLLAQAETVKRRVVRANLRLVVSIAKRHVGWSPKFFEVISDGNVSLMRAVEKFDYARGNKFSTYASWAIIKNFARSIPEQHYYCSRFMTGQDAVLEGAADESVEQVHASDRQRVRELISEGLASLTDREQAVVQGHFGLTPQGATQTLEQLGKRFGVTKERVRQIEQRALARLRSVLAPSLIDAISD